MKANIQIYLTTAQWLEVDLDELVAEHGKKALTKAFLEDYAIGHAEFGGAIIDSEFEIEIEKEPAVKKVKRGRGSY